MLKVYLAGPEVFLPDAMAVGAAKKLLCREDGFEGLFPFDQEEPSEEELRASPKDRIIYRDNLSMMRLSDFGVFNLTPFRGIGADPGTAFELGAFVGMGKPVFGYSNDGRTMLERVRTKFGCSSNGTVWRDEHDMFVEDFGNADNLMISGALASFGSQVVLGSASGGQLFRNLGAFRRCLAEAKRVLSRLTAWPPSGDSYVRRSFV